MTREELVAAADEAYARYRTLREQADALGSEWCKADRAIQEFDRNAEVERLVAERLAEKSAA